jgi:hypothetical protein
MGASYVGRFVSSGILWILNGEKAALIDCIVAASGLGQIIVCFLIDNGMFRSPY